MKNVLAASARIGAFCAAFVGAGCDPEVGFVREASPEATSADDAGVRGDGSTEPISFARDIRPIIERGDGPPAGCKRCHYPTAPAPQGFMLGGLDLSSLGKLRNGGVTSGRNVVVAGDPAASILIQKLEGTYPRGARMPKDLTPLSNAEIALIKQWIAEGARGADNE